MRKVVLITGASSGFGFLTAKTLANQGYIVYGSMREVTARNAFQAKALTEAGVVVVELDVTSMVSVQAAVDCITAQQGRLDAVINNAGFASAGVSEAFSDEQFMAMLNVNVLGVQRVYKAVLPVMRKQEAGLVVNIGSILGRVTFPFFGLYGATKFALEALTESYRYELSQLGINTVLVQPSAFPTSMYANVQQPEKQPVVASYGDVGQIPNTMFEQFMALFESEDAPNPQEVASAIAKLLSLPSAELPDRVAVGNDFGANAINEFNAKVQAATIAALGLSSLEKVNK